MGTFPESDVALNVASVSSGQTACSTCLVRKALHLSTIMSNFIQDAAQKTPKKNHPSLSAVNDTPQSRGSSTNTSYASNTLVPNYGSFLAEDLESAKIITPDLFIELILGASINEFKPLSSYRQNRYEKALDRYLQTVNETDRYAPFCELANEILLDAYGFYTAKVDKKAIIMQLCRNDPQIVQGSPAKRKPDVATVTTKAYTYTGRDSVDNMMKEGPKGKPFYWSELALFWEFKMEHENIRNCKQKPKKIKHFAPMVKGTVVCQSSTFHRSEFYLQMQIRRNFWYLPTSPLITPVALVAAPGRQNANSSQIQPSRDGSLLAIYRPNSLKAEAHNSLVILLLLNDRSQPRAV